MLSSNHFPRPTIHWVRACLAPALALIALGVDRGYQTDFWHHLARGRLLAQSSGLADVDTFTFTVAGQAMQDANWLSQLLYHRLFTWGGLELVQFANALVIAATFALLTATCALFPLPVRRGRMREGPEGERRTGGAAAVSVAAFIALRQTFLIRPQSFSLLLFIASYFILTRGSGRGRWLWLMPPVMALWANVHGGFPIGLCLIAAFTLAEGVKAWGKQSIFASTWHYAGCLAMGVVATFVNPYGWKIYGYVLNLSSRAAGRGIEEWLPPSFSNWTGAAFIASVVAVAALAFLTRRTRRDARGLLIAACFLPLACGSMRMTAWWILAAAPAAAGMITSLQKTHAQKSPVQPSWAPGAALAVIAVACVVASPWMERFNPLFSLRPAARTESRLQQIADDLPPGRLFTRLEWGEYFDWSRFRSSSVFMDGRIEIYPDSVWADYLAVSAGRGNWREILKKYSVDALVLDNAYHTALLSQVDVSPEWNRVATAGRAVAFVRVAPANEAASASVSP